MRSLSVDSTNRYVGTAGYAQSTLWEQFAARGRPLTHLVSLSVQALAKEVNLLHAELSHPDCTYSDGWQERLRTLESAIVTQRNRQIYGAPPGRAEQKNFDAMLDRIMDCYSLLEKRIAKHEGRAAFSAVEAFAQLDELIAKVKTSGRSDDWIAVRTRIGELMDAPLSAREHEQLERYRTRKDF